MRQQEFQAQQQQRMRQGEMQNMEMMQARQQANFQDAEAAIRLAAAGNYEAIIALGEDRMRLDERLGGPLKGDTTPMLVNMARRAAVGDTQAANQLNLQLLGTVEQGRSRGVLQMPEVQTPLSTVGKIEADFKAGRITQEQRDQAMLAASRQGTTVNVQAPGEATPEFFKDIDKQFAAILDAAGTSASARPQLEMLSQLAPLTTTGAIPAQISRMFPTFNDANTAFIGITNSILPSLRVPGSGAQSDKDVDVLLNSISNLGAGAEVKQLLIQSLISKDQINQERADIAEQYAAGEITRPEAIRKDRALRSRSILPEGLQGALNAVSGIPKSAREAGVTLDEWRSMTPAEKNTFK
jgi:hypothetical protein